LFVRILAYDEQALGTIRRVLELGVINGVKYQVY
jgi:hypothetical protein